MAGYAIGRNLPKRSRLRDMASRPGNKLLIKVAAATILGFWVNILSSAVSEGAALSALPAVVGWWMFLLPIGVALLIFDLLNDVRAQRKIEEAREVVRDQFRQQAHEADRRIAMNLVLLLAQGARHRDINIHLFYADKMAGKTVLRKDRTALYEVEVLPRNFTLDIVYPDTDELVICDAFNRDQLVYEKLPASHPERYNENLKDKVDPAISWVLACPMHAIQGEPAGVICAFGARAPLEDGESLQLFEGLMSLAGSIMATSSELATPA